MSARSLVTIGDMPPGSKYTLTRDDDVEYTVISHGENRSRVLGPDGNTIHVATGMSRYFVGKVAAEPPPFVPVAGPSFVSDPFDYDNSGAWSDLVSTLIEMADEYGAWFMVGRKANGDSFVIDVLRPRHQLRELIRRNNLRSFTFWRFPS